VGDTCIDAIWQLRHDAEHTPFRSLRVCRKMAMTNARDMSPEAITHLRSSRSHGINL
jgi:hypothetical protein